MFVSLAAALVAAVCYGFGSVMQAIAVRAASRRPALAAAGVAGRVDPSLVIRMLRQWPFLVSIVIDLIGFACQVIALRRLPLFEVQVIIASNLAVTAVFASWLMHTILSLREWAAVLAVVVGIALLGSSAGVQGAATVGVDFHLALIAAIAAIAVVGLAAARLPSKARTPALGALAGMGYGVLAVCARILPGFSPSQLVRSPAAYTLAAAGIISFMLYASALESGSVTVATAAVILVETVPPAIVGVLLLGDTTRHGMTGVAIAGFMLALVCAIVLARFGEAGTEKSTVLPVPQQASGSAEAPGRSGTSGQSETFAPSGTSALPGSFDSVGPARSADSSHSAGSAGSADSLESAGSADSAGPPGAPAHSPDRSSRTHPGLRSGQKTG